MREFTTTSEQETENLGEQIAEALKPGTVIAFRGGLGAGKTAFTRGLAKGMGIEGEAVSSPTFALVHEYRGKSGTLCHFDMYRVEDWQSLYSTGFFDYLDSGCVLAVEWSENIENALPEDAIIITIEVTGETTRRISISGGGDAF